MSANATTAADIHRALRRRQFRSSTSVLADLTSADAAAVAQALARARVSPSARVNLDVLVRTIKEERASREEAEREARAGQPNRYGEFLRLTAELAGDQPRPGAQPDQPQPDQPKPQRRSTPRTWSRRTGEPKPKPRRPARKTPAARPQPPPEALYLGPRAFGAGIDGDRPLGCPEGVDYALWKNPSRPPWLLDDGEHDADDELDFDD